MALDTLIQLHETHTRLAEIDELKGDLPELLSEQKDDFNRMNKEQKDHASKIDKLSKELNSCQTTLTDHNTKLERYSTCASECNAPDPMALPYSDDRRRLRRRRLTSDICQDNVCSEPYDDANNYHHDAADYYNCVDCISRCMGCTKTCQCPTDFIWTHNR